MKQRFGIALALLGDPRLIIVDEPTAGLDPEERVRFLNLLSEIGENVIVILSTHILPEAEANCRRVILIHEGRKVVDGPVSELTAEYGSLEQMFARHTYADTATGEAPERGESGVQP